MNTQREREEQDLADQVNSGEISEQEFRREMADLQRGYRVMAEEAAQEAYDDVMDRW